MEFKENEFLRKDSIKAIEERVELQGEKNKLTKQREKFEIEKLEFLVDKEIILKEIKDLRRAVKRLKEELQELEEVSNICVICRQSQRIQLDCCSGAMCYNCWDEHEQRKNTCPFCRAPLPRLIDIMIKKIDKLNS